MPVLQGPPLQRANNKSDRQPNEQRSQYVCRLDRWQPVSPRHA
jgi:hypothetical protein